MNSPSPLLPQSRRAAHIDALRGMAVFGILLVNIWSFVWGSEGLRYGILPPSATGLDRAVIFFIAFLAEGKFYPIFAFLFGAGFALQTRSIYRAVGDRGAVKQIYRRRLTWLLLCGVLHGTLIWLGDILTLYAVAGFWIAGYAGVRLRTLKKSLRLWAAIFVFLTGMMLFFGFLMGLSADDTGYAKAMLDAIRANHVIYTQGTVLEIARERIGDYAQLMLDSVFYFPQVVVLFIAGIFAVRLGWLTRPDRHRELWGRVLRAAFMIGLPLNLGFAVFSLMLTSDPIRYQAADYFFRTMMEVAGPLLAAGYVAAFLRARATVHAWTQFLLAPVGRMALTNYLSQSVLCVLILQGAGLGLGLGLGKNATPAFLLAVALSIMVLQLLFSRWWLARNDHGPMEALWRRFTYGAGLSS